MDRNHFHWNFTENKANQFQNQHMLNNKADYCSLGFGELKEKEQKPDNPWERAFPTALHLCSLQSQDTVTHGQGVGTAFSFFSDYMPFMSPPKWPMDSLIYSCTDCQILCSNAWNFRGNSSKMSQVQGLLGFATLWSFVNPSPEAHTAKMCSVPSTARSLGPKENPWSLSSVKPDKIKF